MQEQSMVRISKSIARVLRHRAKEYGLKLNPHGFVSISSLLSCKNQRGQTGLPQGTTEADLQRVIENDTKQRYLIEGNMIRANQGHSKEVDLDDSAMHTALNGPTLPHMVVHGTNRKAIRDIKASGNLKRMGRRHIHMARGMPGESGVISGMGKSCSVFVWIDCHKAVQPPPVGGGCKFLESENGVILCAEDIPCACFDEVIYK